MYIEFMTARISRGKTLMVGFVSPHFVKNIVIGVFNVLYPFFYFCLCFCNSIPMRLLRWYFYCSR